MKALTRLMVLFCAFGFSHHAHSQDEVEGTLKCQGYLGSVSLNTTLIIQKVDTPRNPNRPKFFDIQITLDGSDYSKDTFRDGAGFSVPSTVMMDYFSCADRTYDPKMKLHCGGYKRGPGIPMGNYERLNPAGISVNVSYWVDGSITAQAIVNKKSWTPEYDLGRNTVYRCRRVE